MHAGDIMIIPPNVPHEFRFTQDTIDIDDMNPIGYNLTDPVRRAHRRVIVRPALLGLHQSASTRAAFFVQMASKQKNIFKLNYRFSFQ
jgi:hypothetical protein